MTSDEETMSSESCTTVAKRKRERKIPLASIAATQSCIAAAMASVIGNMTNLSLQHQCMLMLQVETSQQVQGKILELLQEIDFNILEEQEKMDKAKRAKAKKKNTKE